MTQILIERPGMLATIQDLGRFGQTQLGLSNGGVADKTAYYWLNRLLENAPNTPCIELSFGGMVFYSRGDSQFCLTGAEMPIRINGQSAETWRTYRLQDKDKVEIGYAKAGVRAYLGFRGGIDVAPQFNSASTVLREAVGGVDGGKLQAQQCLDLNSVSPSYAPSQKLMLQDQPRLHTEVRLRVIPGYQQKCFSRLQQRRFFNGAYEVSKQADRMGYRLNGPAIECQQSNMLSEGISLGAIQIPSDGQPIILLQDRQTIGGYPKIGAVLSLDLDKLVQCQQGTKIEFEPISMDCAHNELMLDKARRERTELQRL